MNDSKSKSNRILSIDIMRGLTLFLMLFVNDLFVPGVPTWLVHTKGNVDGMGLGVCGSLVWALAMVGFTALLAKINIRLKL
jgi:hypothetical protein